MNTNFVTVTVTVTYHFFGLRFSRKVNTRYAI